MAVLPLPSGGSARTGSQQGGSLRMRAYSREEGRQRSFGLTLAGIRQRRTRPRARDGAGDQKFNRWQEAISLLSI